MNSSDVIICYLELRKTRSVFPIPLEFEISKFACTYNTEHFLDESRYTGLAAEFLNINVTFLTEITKANKKNLIHFSQRS